MNILRDPWNVAYFLGFIAYLRIRAVYAHRCKHEQKAHRQVDGVEKLLLILVIPTSILFPLLYLFTPLLSFADSTLPTGVRCFGLVVMLLALWLFWRSHADLGQNWSVTLEVRRGHELVKRGVYRWIRHPMYAAIWLWTLAQGLLLSNWLAGWAAFVAFAAMYFVRAPREERMMCEHFGDEYRDYMRCTGRLLPRLR
jgi:protein-S-isoprenylcysteine O-methyltransferase Ste14